MSSCPSGVRILAVPSSTSYTTHWWSVGFRHSETTIKLKRGGAIGPRLLKAIEESRVSIVVLSRNYASSRWCMDELEKIMECRRTLRRVVLPVFYCVEPSDVRRQTGVYADTFASHQQLFRDDQVQRWRAALTEVAYLSGFVLTDNDRSSSKVIKKIIKEVRNITDRASLNVADYPVGIDARAEKLIQMLKLESNDVRIVAIWGMGGIGKTATAKAVYNLIHRKFDSSCFLLNVGATWKQYNGPVKLQKKLLSDILLEKKPSMEDYEHGIIQIKQRAWCRRVFLVLDGVDDGDQLKTLAINRESLCSGSRIIITIRDLSSISSLELPENEVYKPKELDAEESLKLFSWHAFKKKGPLEDYRMLSAEMVGYAKVIPLVLEILGSFFSDKIKSEWISELKKLKEIPHDDVQAKLKLSYDSLNVRRALLQIDSDNRLIMHVRIQDMGREIVRQESVQEPGERSRLWNEKDVLDVLQNYSGRDTVEGLLLNLQRSNEPLLDAKAFVNMSRLKLLHLNYIRLVGSHKHLSRRLVWLCWIGYPLNCIPSTLFMGNMVAIDLSYSKLKVVWRETKILKKLKYLNLSHSYLIETPNFTGLASLEILLLNDCTKLLDVHHTIECLQNLLVLNMKNCQDLHKLLRSIFMLKSLNYLDLSGCFKLGIRRSWRSIVRSLGLPEQSDFSIFLPGSEVPNWCNYQCVGSFLSFLVPPLVGRNIQGWILCVVFVGRLDDEDNDDDMFAISCDINNKTMGTKKRYQPTVDGYPVKCKD
ncbi:disease resistance protein RPV1-like [Cornus florida]|uniref:disease resistance protein RPV1-like n=1 Tax=Cornus florida TaxID=4283 RepID=UPI0028A06249|nr:disease resistance protein RPV1-like [Cornus florida]